MLRTLHCVERLAPSSVLEVAAGSGFVGACVHRPGRRVVVNDLRLDAEQFSDWTTGDELVPCAGNLFDLSPEDLGVFDLVMACEVIEHVAHGPEMIAHLGRFVRPGGSVLLTTPNGEYFRSKLPTYSQISDFSALESEQFKPDADGHLYLYTADEMQRVLEAAGFVDVKIDLTVTPFLSGNAGLRFLPAHQALLPAYYGLDATLRRSGGAVRGKACTQMIATARRPR